MRTLRVLRLLLWEDCQRDCQGCCNKDWDLITLETLGNFTGYDQILLTGGEPMMYTCDLIDAIDDIKKQTKTPIYIYTADVSEPLKVMGILGMVAGLTLTLHNQEDILPFLLFNSIFGIAPPDKSMRLNVFKGVKLPDVNLDGWTVKRDIEWIKNCPLPKGEVFRRYDDI